MEPIISKQVPLLVVQILTLTHYFLYTSSYVLETCSIGFPCSRHPEKSTILILNELSDTCNVDRNRFIVVYADDILLISPSVVNLENLIHVCERELNWLDMAINYKKILLLTYWTTMLCLMR